MLEYHLTKFGSNPSITLRYPADKETNRQTDAGCHRISTASLPEEITAYLSLIYNTSCVHEAVINSHGSSKVVT